MLYIKYKSLVLAKVGAKESGETFSTEEVKLFKKIKGYICTNKPFEVTYIMPTHTGQLPIKQMINYPRDVVVKVYATALNMPKSYILSSVD